MKIDFFDTSCKEQENLEHQQFGICDDENGQKAYTNINDTNKWIATVNNEARKKIEFTAIDNCIEVFKDDTNDKESSCDGMLTFDKSIYLVELKKQGTGGWLPKAMSQLKNTIKLIENNNNLEGIPYKKAYVCNRKHPHFQVIDVEKKRRFYNETGFRIDAQAEIIIK